MDKIQKYRKDCRSLPMGYYHLCSDGWKEGVIFHTSSQYAAGVTSLALAAFRNQVKIYAYTLMPNHFHILLSGTGKACVQMFTCLTRRCNKVLRKTGDPPLPERYGFKLIPVTTPESLRSHFLYIARNPYEKGYAGPGGYLWGSDYLFDNQLAAMIHGQKGKEISWRKQMRTLFVRERVPSQWEIHPELGVLPRSFVAHEKILESFPSKKAYYTRLVKDYESFSHISAEIQETLSYSNSEVDDILFLLVKQLFPQKTWRELMAGEKLRVAVILHRKFGIEVLQIAERMHLNEYTIRQAIDAKEYRHYEYQHCTTTNQHRNSNGFK